MPTALRLIVPRVIAPPPNYRPPAAWLRRPGMREGMGDINTIAQAVQTIEGYCPPNTTYGCSPCVPGGSCAYPNGTAAYQNNNPGNLNYAGQPGATKNGRWASFPTYDAGYQALLNQIQGQAGSGQTLQQFIYQYAPPSDGNNTEKYLSSLESATGYSRSTPLAAVISGTPGVPLPAGLTPAGDADASTFPDLSTLFDSSADGSAGDSSLPGWALPALAAGVLLAIALD